MPPADSMQGATSLTKQHYDSLQAGRGLAAVAVLLFHTWLMARDKLGQVFAQNLFIHGDRGVDFFFVLSGFIILHANWRSVGVPNDAPRYFYRRLVRVYPIFLVITAVKLAYMLLGGPGIPAYKSGLSHLLCSTLLIPLPDFPFLAVSWSLCFEMFFYSIFLLFILFGWRFRWWLFLHVAVCLVINIPGMPSLDYPGWFFVHTRILDFYLGCAAAWICARGFISTKFALTLAACGVVMLVLGHFTHDQLEAMLKALGPLYWGIAFFLIITGVATLERLKHFSVPPWLTYLGDASYSVYLVHNNVILVGGAVLAKRLHIVENYFSLTMFVVAGASLAAGIACYQFIEKPVLRWFQNKGPVRNSDGTRLVSGRSA